jgi:hypothetical protein
MPAEEVRKAAQMIENVRMLCARLMEANCPKRFVDCRTPQIGRAHV